MNASAAPTAPPEFRKLCKACGATYGVDAWRALPYAGRISDPEETLELRNCLCGSTLAVIVDHTP